MAPTPAFDPPESHEVVGVRIIDTTARITVPLDMVDTPIKGHEMLICPSFSFLIEHKSGRKLLFDLGVRKDWENLSPVLKPYFAKTNAEVTVEKGVREQLEEHNINVKEIEGIIWSHWHWDHVGDPSTFDPITSLIVGPGVKAIFLPAYPTNPASPLLDSDFAGRQVKEIDFQGQDALRIGNFDALDYFGDGSFYILDAPGHTVGHISALARVTAYPPSFILMGADVCHHSGEMRPSQWMPLPPHINLGAASQCPGDLFDHLLKNGDRAKPFYGQKRPGLVLCDPDIAEMTIEGVQEADASGNVLVVIAHDDHLHGVVKFFPEYANNFLAEGCIEKARWQFLQDFRHGVPAMRC